MTTLAIIFSLSHYLNIKISIYKIIFKQFDKLLNKIFRIIKKIKKISYYKLILREKILNIKKNLIQLNYIYFSFI